MQEGKSGDHKSVGGGVYESRIHSGPGYRIYYAMRGAEVVVLLGGGDKSSQPQDIRRAKKIAEAAGGFLGFFPGVRDGAIGHDESCETTLTGDFRELCICEDGEFALQIFQFRCGLAGENPGEIACRLRWCVGNHGDYPDEFRGDGGFVQFGQAIQRRSGIGLRRRRQGVRAFLF